MKLNTSRQAPFSRIPAPLKEIRAFVGANTRKPAAGGHPLAKRLLAWLTNRMRALTWEQAYFLGGAIGAALAALGVRWPVARTNLEIVFGNRLTLVEKRRIFKAAWVNFGRVAINHLRLPYMPPEFWSSHVRFPDEGNLRALFDRRRGIIIACGHMGMMDLAGGRLGKCGYPVAVVAKPMRSPSIDHLVLSAREALYMSTIPHRDSARRILKGLRSGEAIFFIIDQNMKRSQGIFVDWFGQPASVSPAAAVFARQTKAPVVAGYLEQTGPKQFILHMSAPLPWISIADDPDTELVVNSQNQANAYQKLILAKPELWFWIHRRWKIQPKGKKWPYPN